METQGQRIRRVRDEKGIKQKFISETTGITQAHLSRIENDESGVTRNTLRKIADALGVSFESLYIPKPSDRIAGSDALPVSIDEVLASESAMIRFMGGDRPDDGTMEWVRRSLGVIRDEVRRRRQ
ncbi:MAG: helix-turn-helix transcriptional regulator [Bacteroidetes bacterium]|nr:helix-turn-helix transcriptional regulator [Bacteroidota bacterium]